MTLCVVLLVVHAFIDVLDVNWIKQPLWRQT